MARARGIKPSLFLNEELAECSISARYLFSGLWCLADREGRLEDRPKRIKAEIYPYDNQNIDKLLNELFEAGFIVRYKVDESALLKDKTIKSASYIQILNFTKHQNPHPKEKESEIPACEAGREKQFNYTASSGNSGTRNASSLIPSSLIPSSLIPSSAQPRKKAASASGFEIFWNAFPNRRSKAQALKAWEKIKPDEQLQNEILKSLERAKTLDFSKRPKNKIPYPATWLNAKGWEDEIDADYHSDEKNDTDDRFRKIREKRKRELELYSNEEEKRREGLE